MHLQTKSTLLVRGERGRGHEKDSYTWPRAPYHLFSWPLEDFPTTTITNTTTAPIAPPLLCR